MKFDWTESGKVRLVLTVRSTDGVELERRVLYPLPRETIGGMNDRICDEIGVMIYNNDLVFTEQMKKEVVEDIRETWKLSMRYSPGVPLP